MGKPPSKQITSNVGTQTKRTKTNLVGTFIYSVLVALIMGGIFQAISLPKACNEDPQTPIMKLESQFQEELTELTKPLRKMDAWLENNLDENVKLVLPYFSNVILFLGFSLYYFLINSAFKESAIDTLGVFVSTFGGMYLAYMLNKDYFFQDSSEDCKMKLDEGLHHAQMNIGFFFVLLGFIAFQQFLTKNCEN